MELGVSSFAFGWAVGVPSHPPPHPLTELELLAYARERQLSLVQLGDHLPLHEFDAARLARLRAAADGGPAPLALEIGARGLTPAHLACYLDLATQLRSALVRFVIDQGRYEPEADQVIGLLRDAAPELEKKRVTLGLENHDRFSARTLRRIVETVSSDRVGICLDTANSLGAGEGFEHVLDQLGPCTVNLHLKDFAITRVPYAMGFVVEGRPAGAGSLDIPAICERVRRYGHCRTAVLETWVPPEATLDETLVKERDWADQSLAYLKSLFPKP